MTPQITAANTVIMQVQLENSSPDFTRAVNGIPPIDTQRAVTSLLVSDGQTSVIGGIYVNRQQDNNARTPGIHKIPMLGWLFKNQRTDRSKLRAADLHHAADHQALMNKGEVFHMRAVLRSSMAGAGLVAILIGSASCGDVARTGRSPSMMIIQSLEGASGASPPGVLDVPAFGRSVVGGRGGRSNEGATFFNDIGQATLRLEPKDRGLSGTGGSIAPLNQVVLNRYRIEFHRTDGRETTRRRCPIPV